MLVRPETEKPDELFEQIIHHDARGGLCCCAKLYDHRMSNCFAKHYPNIRKQERHKFLIDGYFNMYISLGTFSRRKRNAQSLYNRGTIYIDMDYHVKKDDCCCRVDQYRIEQVKKETLDLLMSLFENGDLAAPTIITDSGRGLALYYVLENSIANTEAAKKSMQYFQFIYDLMIVRVNNLMEEHGGLMRADTAVSDVSRVARLPDTYNQNARVKCKFLYLNQDDTTGEPKYFSLTEIRDTCQLEELMWEGKANWPKKKKYKKIKKDESLSAQNRNFLKKRLDNLLDLQDSLGPDCMGIREKLLFLIYNTMLPLFGNESISMLKEMNMYFAYPLGEREIEHLIFEGKKRTYKYSNERIITFLGLSDEAAIKFGFKKPAVTTKRQEREKRNSFIVSLALDSNEYTYDMIAERCNVSVRTVKYVLKKAGVSRYNVEKTTENNTQQEKSVSKNEDRTFLSGESAKNNTKSYGVARKDSTTVRQEFVLDDSCGDKDSLRAVLGKICGQFDDMFDLPYGDLPLGLGAVW